MLMKRFRGKTLTEAMERARKTCGDDALLIETRQIASGYLVVAARPHQASDDLPARPAIERAGRRAWTRGFTPLAEGARAFGMSNPVLRAVENAIVGTAVRLDRPGDPALSGVATRILRALIKVQTMDLPKFKVTAFIGSTGVGKTTTLAKLAAAAVRERDESVAIVTIDTYRVAAVEQLRAFAEMLAVPFEVAFTPQELRRALQQHAGADRVFIDTSGRSPFDEKAIAALRGMLEPSDPACALCLPASARRSDGQAALGAFGALDPDCAILTKWDETAAPGEVMSLAIERGLPISHVTIGQEVPEDIVDAHAGALAARAFALEEEAAEVVL